MVSVLGSVWYRILTHSISEVLVGTLGLRLLGNPILVQWVWWVIGSQAGEGARFWSSLKQNSQVNSMVGIRSRTRGILAIAVDSSECKGADRLGAGAELDYVLGSMLLPAKWTSSQSYKMVVQMEWVGLVLRIFHLAFPHISKRNFTDVLK